MPSLVHLQQDHAMLGDIIGRLTEITARPAPPVTFELFNLRRELGTALTRHLKEEDWVLYPVLLASEDARIGQTARRFVAEMGGLAGSFLLHTQKWNAFAIEADWPGYCAEARALLEKLAIRIAREDAELYPLLNRVTRPTADPAQSGKRQAP